MSKDQKIEPGTGGNVVQGVTAVQQAILASTTAPAPRGILDQLKDTQAAERGESTGSSGQSHTFGAWCRAKGISALELSRLMREDNVSIPRGEGDGPMMTEEEFDRSVRFRIVGAFGTTTETVKVAMHADPAAHAKFERDEADKARKV